MNASAVGMNNVIAFPTVTKPDSYSQFKSNDEEMEKFNDTVCMMARVIREQYPDIHFEDRDFVLMAESTLAMIMRSRGIEHPLNQFADTIGVEFLEEYM